MADEIPEDAERVAVLDALRQGYALIAAQRRLLPDIAGVEPALDETLSAIRRLAAAVKGTE